MIQEEEKNQKNDLKIGRRRPTFYSEDFKKKIISEYLETRQTKQEILDKYGIRSKSPLQKWMKEYGILDPYAKKDYLGVMNTIRTEKNPPQSSDLELQVKELQEQNKRLERQLLEERIRAEMFGRVIELAEKEFKLPIRKKYDTK